MTTTVTRRGLVAAATTAAPTLAITGCGRPLPGPSDPLLLDDQSRLNATRVGRNLRLSSSAAGFEDEVRRTLQAAEAADQPVCVGGARHSMGGQSLPPAQGAAAELIPSAVRIDPATRTYSVQAGARWRDVLLRLDPYGWSPAVTQSNHDFTIGGAISVNAHGWAVPMGPVGETVRSLRLMRADGTVVRCSPEENSDLFGLCLGGYGLFGVLLNAELAAVDNQWLDRTQDRLAAEAFAPRFAATVRAPEVRMAYGRLSLSKRDFLKDAILIAHRPAAEQPSPLPPLDAAGGPDGLARRLFRGQTGSDGGKRLRWWAETRLVPGRSTPATRNSLMNVPVRSFAGSDPRRTDILHEYFVPPDALEGFLKDCRRIIPAFEQDLLNVTLRWLEADRRSVLSFAPEPRIALVMLFSQTMSAAAEADMRALTERLIDAALAAQGSFYLPYRLHARPEQLKRAYPRLEEFVGAKRSHDPALRFRNQMWDRYFADL